MSKTNYKKPIILAVLFLLPVIFLLFLYPSTHNYQALDIIKGDIKELSDFKSVTKDSIQLSERITILGFLGKHPNSKTLAALNLKELIYDKFQGFKKFQVVMVVSIEAQEKLNKLKKELYQYNELKYWNFAVASDDAIKELYKSLRSEDSLDNFLASEEVFIIDKERNQRGRIDDRDDREIEKQIPVYGLYSYNCIEVAELKNKMSEDLRVLFTEYRQKRKGTFNSTTRRASDIRTNE